MLRSLASRAHMLALCVLAASCGKGSDSKKAPAPGPPVAQAEVVATVKPLTAADVAFLVTGCVATGFDADKCQCVGEEARTTLARELVDKLRNAPPDDDHEAVQKYYTGAEVQAIVSFLKKSSNKCKIEGG